ncbi:hypothetical protein HCN44_005618 [Aphidius gifuensis]|uniref:THAP-type domain-containing protein n=1 Tax=Aphidius gifuensis TaxID=684658 RepID=A0A834Y3H9_APHGI|nr:uncharacterized protein LOC122847601 [Aphidius gifuensis]KAF7997341.1 hypothetical protein HCN44_005618 [Aphidius gifuensis]
MNNPRGSKDVFKKKCSVCGFQSKNNSEVSFHVYPRDIKMREKWIDALRTDKSKLNFASSLIVCSQHFNPKTDFLERPPGIGTKRRGLKPTAVPSYEIIPRPSTRSNSEVDTLITINNTVSNPIQSSSIFESDINNQSVLIDHNEIFDDISEISIIENSYNSPEITLQVSETEETMNEVDVVEETSFNDKSVESFIRKMIKTDKQLDGFTGLHSFSLFTSIVNNIVKSKSDNNLSYDVMDIEDAVLLTFIKLKLNITYVCLAAIFKVTEKKAQEIFIDTLNELESLFSNMLDWPSNNEITMGKLEEQNYENYSDYTDASRVKFIISIASTGLISYVSKAFNNKLFSQAEIGDDDCTKTDKGFEIDIECTTVNLQLLESKLKTEIQCDGIKIETDDSHVDIENTLRRIKIFKILNGTIPNYLSLYCEKIMHVICGLFNLGVSHDLQN